MTVIDTTVSLSSAQLSALRAAGVTAVVRYLAPQSWKRLTPTEAGRYGAAGMQLVANWESGARDLLTLDAATTAAHAREAVRQAQADGLGAGCWIYNSGADYDVQAGDWSRIAANLRIIRPIYRSGGYGIGMYSSWDALTWARRDGLVDGLWQSMSASYSGGRNARPLPGAHLRQHLPTTIAGVSCDPNDILISPFGQAGLSSTTTSTGGPTVGTVDDFFNRPTVAPDGQIRFADTVGRLNYSMPATAASLAALAAKLDALTAAVQAMAAGGTSVDTAAVIAHIDQVASTESATVAGLHDQIADLQHRLAAAGGALAG